MLKPIVENMDRRAEAPLGEPAGQITIGADEDDRRRAAPARASVVRRRPRSSVASTEAPSDTTVTPSSATRRPYPRVSTAGRSPLWTQQARDVLDERCFPAAADAKIADADDRPIEPVPPRRVLRIPPAPPRCRRAIDRAQWTNQ